MGARARRARFMPGYLVFPGGRLEPEDGEGDEGLARCASRELEEETGLRVPPQAWRDLGERVTPPLFPVRFRTRFFLAQLPSGAALPPEPPAPEEIEGLEFVEPGGLMERWRAGRALVPPPVLPLLRSLALRGGDDLDQLATRLALVNAVERAGPRIEFVPGIWMLPVRTPTLPPATHTNVWMPGTSPYAVVDPGSDDPTEVAALRAVLARRRALGHDPAAVVLTHAHPDHVAGAVGLARDLEVPLRAHVEVLAKMGAPGEALGDGDVLELGGLTLRAVHTPGHAPGHLAFHVPEREALISGDLVSSLSTILVDPEDGDMGAFLDSLRRAAALGCRTLLPGHGAPLPGEALEAAVEHRLAREARVLEALEAAGAEGCAADRIADAAYADTPQAPEPLRRRQSLAHLLHLEAQGRARRGGAGETWRVVDAR
jgi:ribonuclease/clavin/mitogillin